MVKSTACRRLSTVVEGAGVRILTYYVTRSWPKLPSDFRLQLVWGSSTVAPSGPQFDEDEQLVVLFVLLKDRSVTIRRPLLPIRREGGT